MHIVLVDDDLISVFLAEKSLRRAGFTEKVSPFQSPQDALSFVLQTIPEQVPDVILLDLNMPLMSGWEFLEALLPHEAQLVDRCSVYILTSSLAPSDQAQSQDYSFVAGLIRKPLDTEKIQAVLTQAAGSRS